MRNLKTLGIIVLLTVLVLAGCANPFGSNETANEAEADGCASSGTVTIQIGGGGTARSTWPFTQAYIDSLYFRITVTPSNGAVIVRDDIKYGSSPVSFHITTGVTAFLVESFEADSSVRLPSDEPVAEGDYVRIIHPGNNPSVSISMRPGGGRLPDPISFANPTETRTYGSPNFTKAVEPGFSGAGAVTYSSGNTAVATVDPNTGEVTILAAGTTLISAIKAACNDYVSSLATYTLTVNRATLTVTANNFNISFGAPVPVFTYTITGFVDASPAYQAAARSGSPVITSTYTTTSPVGSYPITITLGTLAAANYDFVFVNGSVSVGLADQAALTINDPGPRTFGDPAFTLGTTGGTTNGAVTFTLVSGDAISLSGAGNSTATILRRGTAVVRATMAGNGSFNPVVSADFTINVAPRNLSNAAVTVGGTIVYTGSPLTPVPTVTDMISGTNRITSSDFTVSHSNNTSRGTATVTINATPGGNYTGSQTGNFNIVGWIVTFNANNSSPNTIQIAAPGGRVNPPSPQPIRTDTFTVPVAGLMVGPSPGVFNFVFDGWCHNGVLWNFLDAVTQDKTLALQWSQTVNLSSTAGATIVDQAVNFVNANADPTRLYTLALNSNVSVAGNNNRVLNANNARLMLIGIGSPRTISLSSIGRMFTAGASARTGIELTLGNNITLHGHSANNQPLVQVQNAASLTMLSGASVANNNNSNFGGGVNVASAGSFIMEGGTISQNTATNSGGGVFMSGAGSTFTMEGGTISGNTAVGNGGGVLMQAGTFIMRGGSISANMTSGGIISHGGGVSVTGTATFTMEGGTISGNISAGGGSGVSITLGTFTMSGGTISGNTADRRGGGVTVTGATFTMTDGNISGNTALGGSGGGIEVAGNSIFTMEGGTISGNTVSGGIVFQAGGGVDVFNSTFNMAGGNITGNTAMGSSPRGGGVFVSQTAGNSSIFNKSGASIITGWGNDPVNGNVTRDQSGAVLNNRGHAVEARRVDPAPTVTRRIENTVGSGVNLTWNTALFTPYCSGPWVP